MGGEEFKWRQPVHHHLWSQEGPHSTAKTNDRAHSSGRVVSSGISNIVITSVHSFKNHLKKLMMIIIIKSQEMTV